MSRFLDMKRRLVVGVFGFLSFLSGMNNAVFAQENSDVCSANNFHPSDHLAVAFREINKRLSESLKAFNAREFDEYIAIYERSEDVVYVFGSEVVKGYDLIARNFKDRFFGDKGAKETAESSLYKVEVIHMDDIGPSTLILSAQICEQSPGDENYRPVAVASMVFRHGKSGWRAIYDHSM